MARHTAILGWRPQGAAALLTLLLVLAAGCSSGVGQDFIVSRTTDQGSPGSSAPVPVDGLTTQQLAAEQANAEAALLVAADLAEGWRATGPVDGTKFPEARRKLANCVGVKADRLFSFARTVAYSQRFENPNGSSVEQTVAVSTVGNTELYLTNLAKPSVADCLADEFVDFFQAALDALDETSPTGGPVVDSVEVEAVPVVPVGDESIGYRFTVQVTFGDSRASLYLDLRVTRVGNSISSILAQSNVSSPIEGEELDRLSQVAASRLPIETT